MRMIKPTKLNRFFYWMFFKIYLLLCGVPLGTYIQNFRHTHIGKYVLIAPGVSIISRNHNKYDPLIYDEWSDVIIGDNCWIGSNVTILPGVCLGAYTVVGAGSVVTHSFPHGKCLIIGSPARIIEKW